MRHLVCALLVGTSILAAVPALAQSSSGNDSTTPAPETAASAGDILVTGSRIVRDGYTAPTPVTVAPVEDLVKSTPTNIPDALNKLPQFQNSSSPSRSSHNFANSPDHGNILNLRSVGGNRTLILFDGIRLPPTTFVGTVDVSVIPNALIQRVEVVTAGASAAYGSDAVAGVVNFVLDRKFEGIKGSVQSGIDGEGDNPNQRLSLAAGTSLFDDRAHALFSVDYYNNDGMLRSDRERATRDYVYLGSVPGSTAIPGSDANPFRIFENVRLVFASDDGKILDGPFANFNINPDGTLRPFNNGAPTGTGGFSVGGDGFTIPPNVHAVSPFDTLQTFGRFQYSLTPDVTAFVQGNLSRTSLNYLSQANAFTGTQNAPVFEGNPFIPVQIAAALAADPIPNQQFNVGKYNGNSGTPPATKERTDFWMVTAGLEGKLGTWSWNSTYSHGDSRHSVDQSGLYNYQRTYAALDAVRDNATNNIVCAPTLSTDPVVRARFAGCQPLNIFLTGANYVNQPGYAYATGTMSYDARMKQDQAQLSFQGSLFDLPAGPVDLAIGGEYRSQKLNLASNSDPSLLDTPAERAEHFRGLRGVAPASLFYWLTNVGQARGTVNVKEAFAEVNVPIFKDAPFFQALTLNAAGRITDYSTSGRVETWKVGATWRPIEDLLFRGTLSRDIRAPTLFDLFAGDQSGIGLLNDPVTGISQNLSTVTGGNAALKPEKSKTLALGAVLTPRFLPGFSLSVDYYRLDITGAIGTLSGQQIVNNCFADAASPECALITRPGANAFPTAVRLAPANIAFLRTSGVDVDASYRTQLGQGTLGLRLYASYLDEYVTQQSATAPVLDFAGYGNNAIGRPRWRGTLNVNYEVGGFNLFVSEQLIGKMKVGSPEVNQNYGGAHTPAVFYTDVTVSYRVDAMAGTFEPFLTINNLFDRDPPIVPGTIPGVNVPTIYSTFDQVGRAFTAGVRFKF